MTASIGLRIRTVAALVGGRAAYRLAMYGTGVGLLALWGADEFARYASATGAVAWLFALTSSGPEKAALALVSRAGGAVLERLFVWLAVAPFAVLSLGYLALWTVGPHGTAQRYAAAAALMAGVGCSAVLVALYRIRGEHRVDALAYAVLAAGYLLALAFAGLLGLRSDGILAVLLCVTAAVVVALLAGLLSRSAPGRRHTGAPSHKGGWAAGRAAATLGVGELLAVGAASMLYVFLAVAGDADQTSRFYLLMIVSAVASVGWSYLLRLAQPRIARGLEVRGADHGWRLTRRLSGWTAGAGAAATAGLVALLLVQGGAAGQSAVALALEIALFASTAAVLVVAENTDARGRRWSAGGALAQFLGVAVAGWFLVPAVGAAGALAALCAGEVLKAAVLHRAAVSHHAAVSRDAAVSHHAAVSRDAARRVAQPGGQRLEERL